VRFREDKPEDLDRARTAAREWRQGHPAGTAEEFVADVGGRFHKDYGPVLRAVLYADSHGAKITTGISVTEDPS
jgi:hypothetical protein